jgi:uncharacterized membrane protein
MSDAAPGPNVPSSNRNVMILLSYLWLLALIPLIVEKNDREVQWHAKHGLVLFGAEVIFWIAFQVLLMILGTFLSCIAVIFIPVIALGFIVLHLFAIIKGINGQRLIIPGISEYADRF